MAITNAGNGLVDQWTFTNKHVDPNIGSGDGNVFLSTARCILYAALSKNLPASSRNEAGQYTGLPANDGVFFRIGVVQGLSFQEQKQIDTVFELGSDIPYLVPGRVAGGLGLQRVLLSGEDLLNLIYRSDNSTQAGNKQFITSLKDPRLNKAFDLLFAYYGDDGHGGFTTSYSRLFKNCYISSRSEGMNAGQVIVAESVNITYEYISSVTFLSERTLARQ